MKQIKFRGVDVETGKLVFGDLIQPRRHIMIADETGRYEVKPDSVAQLIGVDSHDNDIYEGDIVATAIISPSNDPTIFYEEHVDSHNATFDDFAGIRNGKIVLETNHETD